MIFLCIDRPKLENKRGRAQQNVQSRDLRVVVEQSHRKGLEFRVQDNRQPRQLVQPGEEVYRERDEFRAGQDGAARMFEEKKEEGRAKVGH